MKIKPYRLQLSALLLITCLSVGGLNLVADAYKAGAQIETSKGDIVFAFYEKEAPKTTAHIERLIQSGFYNERGMRWHRVVPEFVIQTGDPTNTGTGGAEEHIDLEVQNTLSHCDAGIVAMARSKELNSASSQFYITLDAQRALDAKYAIFGHVLKGMSILPRITPQDAVYRIVLVDVEGVVPEANAPVQEHPIWGIFQPKKKKAYALR
ncbi:MAG: peptidylprolyl isomerase [Vampirovibrionales bacterium]